MHLIHVVRRYGPVGGMERYVWELTKELHKLGHTLTVICEACLTDRPHGIQIIELGQVAVRPRWLAHIRFSMRVSSWLKKNPTPESVVHSHERINCHDITTFHGAPFATVYEKKWWHLLSIRVFMQLKLESRELSKADFIIPNSELIKRKLTYYYPELIKKFTPPIPPGVSVLNTHSYKAIAKDDGVVAFIGQEWKRKGLKFAIEVVKLLHITRPKLKFHIIGPDPKEIKHLLKDLDCKYQLMGWLPPENHGDFDVLLHPASSEPYGMVISESLAMGIPVVVSDVCGAAQSITNDNGAVLSTTSPLLQWSEAVDRQLSRESPIQIFERSWRDVAKEHIVIYEKCIKSKKAKLTRR